MKALLGDGFPAFEASYEEPPKRGLRVNTLKISAEELRSAFDRKLESTGILDEGFIVEDASGIGRHPFHAAGLFYMQEPSAMSAVAACPADDSGLYVLDMCAAPGGKTGGAAAKMNGRGIIIANEIVPKRAKLLSQNIERLGIPNAAVICERPDSIAKALPRFFDIVLVDAPCSGEGMFRKDENAVREWSPEHVEACSERQKLILESASECTAPCGAIVYSTCTFSKEENEGVVEDFLSKHADFTIEHMERLYPHTSCGEGHFVCRLRRSGRREALGFDRIPPPGKKELRALEPMNSALSDIMENDLPEGVLQLSDDTVRLIPCDMPEAVLDMRCVSCGVELGRLRKGRFEPSHTFFMARLGQRFYRKLVFDKDDPLLASFLSGNTVPCPEYMRGYSAVSVRAGGSDHCIGFGKAVDGTMKNHIPKGLYIN